MDAVYENGVLRPLQPVDLKEHERVIVSVEKAAPTPIRSRLDVDYIEKLKRELEGHKPAPGLEEVRRRLAKIPGAMAAELAAERENRRSLPGYFFDFSAPAKLYHPEAAHPASIDREYAWQFDPDLRLTPPELVSAFAIKVRTQAIVEVALLAPSSFNR